MLPALCVAVRCSCAAVSCCALVCCCVARAHQNECVQCCVLRVGSAAAVRCCAGVCVPVRCCGVICALLCVMRGCCERCCAWCVRVLRALLCAAVRNSCAAVRCVCAKGNARSHPQKEQKTLCEACRRGRNESCPCQSVRCSAVLRRCVARVAALLGMA